MSSILIFPFRVVFLFSQKKKKKYKTSNKWNSKVRKRNFCGKFLSKTEIYLKNRIGIENFHARRIVRMFLNIKRFSVRNVARSNNTRPSAREKPTFEISKNSRFPVRELRARVIFKCFVSCVHRHRRRSVIDHRRPLNSCSRQRDSLAWSIISILF